MQADTKNRAARTLAAFGLALGLFLGFVAAPAASQAGTLAQQATQPVNVPAGGTATVQVRGFCLDFGKPFPTAPMQVKGMADPNVQGAINYAIQKGYTNSNAPQVELAVWNLRDNTWHATEHTIGTEIVNNAGSAPAANTSGTTLADAVSQNKVSVSATFTPQDQQHFYGDGTVTIKNSGNAALSISIPAGTVFTIPGGNYQDLAAYALNTSANQAAQATTTATAATSPTAAATITATVVTTVTAVTTATVATSPTAAETATTAATEVATAATSPTAAAETPTTAVETPTTAVETPTTAVETPTEVPTSAPAAMETPTSTGASLPTTGGSDGSFSVLAILLLVAGSMAVVAGLALKRSQS